MSWKSLVTAGLLCVLASPVFAQPALTVVNGPTLDANGDWQWVVSIEPNSTSVIAGELGFDANSDVVSATAGTEFSGANTENPGSIIFGWEPLTVDTDNDSINDVPSGIEIGSGADADKVFAALGSFNSAGYTGVEEYLTIVTSGPSSSLLTGEVEVVGAYGAGNDEGRIAEETGATTSANYRGYVGTASRTLKAGDMTLNNFTDGDDFSAFLGFYEPGVGGKVGGWSIGDFNRDGFVDGDDFSFFLGGYEPGVMGGSQTIVDVTGILDPPPGAGGGAVSAPEPASIALIGLGLLGGLGLFRRKR